jgi:putative protease
MEQIGAAAEAGIQTVYVDFEDPRRYPDAVKALRGRAEVFLATPRIQKAGEGGFFALIEKAAPDGVLIRNVGALDYFRDRSLRRVGDFSLNAANPLAAEWLRREGLERLTVSYDCNAAQVLDLLRAAPPEWFEVVIHQHLPMFHMDHCVFAAFLTSTGADHTNCGRPCDRHSAKLRDRAGAEHPVKADIGCRNTVFHARAQSGADFLAKFLAAGCRRFRVELLDEDAPRTLRILQCYKRLLAGGAAEALDAVRQLGVTSGTLTVLG